MARRKGLKRSKSFSRKQVEAAAFAPFIQSLAADFERVAKFKITVEADPERADLLVTGFSNRHIEQAIVCCENAKVKARTRYYTRRGFTLTRTSDYGASHKELWFARTVELFVPAESYWKPNVVALIAAETDPYDLAAWDDDSEAFYFPDDWHQYSETDLARIYCEWKEKHP